LTQLARHSPDRSLLQRRMRIARSAVAPGEARAWSRAHCQRAPAPLARLFALLRASSAPRELFGARFQVDKNGPLAGIRFSDESRCTRRFTSSVVLWPSRLQRF